MNEKKKKGLLSIAEIFVVLLFLIGLVLIAMLQQFAKEWYDKIFDSHTSLICFVVYVCIALYCIYKSYEPLKPYEYRDKEHMYATLFKWLMAPAFFTAVSPMMYTLMFKNTEAALLFYFLYIIFLFHLALQWLHNRSKANKIENKNFEQKKDSCISSVNIATESAIQHKEISVAVKTDCGTKANETPNQRSNIDIQVSVRC